MRRRKSFDVSTMTVLRMIRDKTLRARQARPGAPWVIARAISMPPTCGPPLVVGVVR